MKKACILTAVISVLFFTLTFTVYFLNLDMKLVYKVYNALGVHYDKQEKDRRL